MAIAIAAVANIRQNDDAGIRRKRIMQFTGDASYPGAAGSAITANQVALGWIEYIDMAFISNGSAIYFAQVTYNTDGSVTVVFYSATGTQVGAGDLSGYSCVFEVAGR